MPIFDTRAERLIAIAALEHRHQAGGGMAGDQAREVRRARASASTCRVCSPSAGRAGVGLSWFLGEADRRADVQIALGVARDSDAHVRPSADVEGFLEVQQGAKQIVTAAEPFLPLVRVRVRKVSRRKAFTGSCAGPGGALPSGDQIRPAKGGEQSCARTCARIRPVPPSVRPSSRRCCRRSRRPIARFLLHLRRRPVAEEGAGGVRQPRQSGIEHRHVDGIAAAGLPAAAAPSGWRTARTAKAVTSATGTFGCVGLPSCPEAAGGTPTSARRSRSGPVWPKAEIEHQTRRGLRARTHLGRDAEARSPRRGGRPRRSHPPYRRW